MNASTKRGRCLCGQIEFEYIGDVNWILNCHCESCRRATSSPMTTWVSVPTENLIFCNGTPASYSSSVGVERTFCPTCGSPLTYKSDRMPGETHFYAASLEDANSHPPTGHVFESEKLSWFDTYDALPRYATTRKGGTIEPDHYGPREPSR